MNLKKKYFSKKLDTLSISQSLSRVSNLLRVRFHNLNLLSLKKHKSILYNFVNQPDAIKSRFTNEYIEIEEHSKFLSNLNLTYRTNISWINNKVLLDLYDYHKKRFGIYRYLLLLNTKERIFQK